MPGEISITSDMQMTPPLWQKREEELKSFLMKVKVESEKVGLKLNIQKTNIKQKTAYEMCVGDWSSDVLPISGHLCTEQTLISNRQSWNSSIMTVSRKGIRPFLTNS